MGKNNGNTVERVPSGERRTRASDPAEFFRGRLSTCRRITILRAGDGECPYSGHPVDSRATSRICGAEFPGSGSNAVYGVSSVRHDFRSTDNQIGHPFTPTQRPGKCLNSPEVFRIGISHRKALPYARGGPWLRFVAGNAKETAEASRIDLCANVRQAKGPAFPPPTNFEVQSVARHCLIECQIELSSTDHKRVIKSTNILASQ